MSFTIYKLENQMKEFYIYAKITASKAIIRLWNVKTYKSKQMYITDVLKLSQRTKIQLNFIK